MDLFHASILIGGLPLSSMQQIVNFAEMRDEELASLMRPAAKTSPKFAKKKWKKERIKVFKTRKNRGEIRGLSPLKNRFLIPGRPIFMFLLCFSESVVCVSLRFIFCEIGASVNEEGFVGYCGGLK